MKLRKILLTSDLSTESRRAYGPVLQLAREGGASILLLHIVEDIPIVPYGAPLAGPLPSLDRSAMLQGATEALEAERASLAGVKVETLVLPSTNAAESIAEVAAQKGVDLIAMSTHGRTGLRRMVLGSVAEGVVRHSRVPVLVFPPAS